MVDTAHVRIFAVRAAIFLSFIFLFSSAVKSESGADAGIREAMVEVKGGCFEMGDSYGGGQDNERPVHTVCVDDFFISKFEVSQRQWKDVMGENPSHFRNCESCPVDSVNWEDAQAFIRELNESSGMNYRLPTEAEWEYTARGGGRKERWSGTDSGSEQGKYAWFNPNSWQRTHPVGQKRPNALGIYDMSGNVWEWVEDRYGEDYYGSSPKDNPRGPESGDMRVMRGGCWFSSSFCTRTTHRIWGSAGRFPLIGFRLAASKINKLQP